MRAAPGARGAFAALLLLALGGCAGLPRVGGAMREAAREPLTWAPVAGAALLVATDADRELTEWAREQTPLFGSTEGAADASDRLRDLAQVGWFVAALAAPAEDGQAFETKSRALGYGGLAIGATGLVTSGLKHGVGRERPDASDDLSFPSGHTSIAAVAATLGADQAHRRLGPGAARTAVNAAFLGVAFGTGWARVEAGRHHPSDVLAGYALGRFVGRVTELAFLGERAPVAVIATAEGAWVAVSF